MENVSIIALSESHLSGDILDGEIEIDGFICHRSDRIERSHGGVITYIKNNISSTRVLEFSNSKCEVVGVLLEKCNTLILNIYRPPNCSEENVSFEECLERIQLTINDYSNAASHIILCGDLNFEFIEWPEGDFKGRGVSKAVDRIQASNFLDLCECHDLRNLSLVPTRKSNILDLLCTNSDGIRYENVYINSKLSDHNLVKFGVNIVVNESPVTVTNPYDYRIFEYDTSKDDEAWNKFYQDVDSFDVDAISELQPEEQLEILYKLLETKAEEYLERKHCFKTSGQEKRKFIPDNVRKLLRRKLKLSKRYLESNSWTKNHEVIEEIEAIEDKLKEEYRRKKYKEERKVLDKMDRDPSYFFKYAKRFGKKEGSIPSLKGPNGLVSDSLTKARILNSQYSSVWTVPNTKLSDSEVDRIFGSCSQCINEEVHECKEDIVREAIINHREAIMAFSNQNNSLSYKEYWIGELQGRWHDVGVFEKVIDSLKIGAACGPDGLSADLIKRLRDPIARFLHVIYHSSMKVGRFPANLKHALVAGIFKAGDKSMAANYRPISLTNHLGKLLEKVVRQDIIDHLDRNGLWDNRQHGSRAGRSTVSQLLDHYDTILETMETGQNMDTIYLDFSKAFDKVDHHILVQKVKNMGISGNLGMWISTFLMGRTQSVKIDGIVSEKIEILSGVPQGSVLGPILFLIYIADIGSKSKSKAYIYVDDSKVLSSIRGEEDVEFFQNDLENYYYWAKSNNMSFNDTKFVVLRYGKDASIKENTSYFTDGMGWIIEERDTQGPWDPYVF